MRGHRGGGRGLLFKLVWGWLAAEAGLKRDCWPRMPSHIQPGARHPLFPSFPRFLALPQGLCTHNPDPARMPLPPLSLLPASPPTRSHLKCHPHCGHCPAPLPRVVLPPTLVSFLQTLDAILSMPVSHESLTRALLSTQTAGGRTALPTQGQAQNRSQNNLVSEQKSRRNSEARRGFISEHLAGQMLGTSK